MGGVVIFRAFFVVGRGGRVIRGFVGYLFFVFLVGRSFFEGGKGFYLFKIVLFFGRGRACDSVG